MIQYSLIDEIHNQLKTLTMSLNAFTDHYQKWYSHKKCNFSKATAEEIYRIARELAPVLPKDNFTKRLTHQEVSQLNAASLTVEQFRFLMNETVSTLPGYPVVMAMRGCYPSLGPHSWLSSKM